jgi:hypothetical protein
VIAMRPLPGRTRSTVSSTVNTSIAAGLAPAATRRPVNRIVTG